MLIILGGGGGVPRVHITENELECLGNKEGHDSHLTEKRQWEPSVLLVIMLYSFIQNVSHIII